MTEQSRVPACHDVNGVTRTERSMIMGVDPKLELQFSLSGLHVLVLIAAPKKQRHPMSVSGLQINCSTDRKWWVVAKVTDDESLPGLGPIPAFEPLCVMHRI